MVWLITMCYIMLLVISPLSALGVAIFDIMTRIYVKNRDEKKRAN